MTRGGRTAAAAAAVALGALAAMPLAADTQQPYAGYQQRPIKALSQREADDLLAGRGMGMALAAELNGYPGPRHVLDMAGVLGLSDGQRGRAEALFHEMQSSAATLGRDVLAQEAALDRLFAGKAADEPSLRAAVAEAARLNGELRFLHLRYHLAMRALLTPEQFALYNRHRGYGGGPAGSPAGHHPQH